MNPILKKAKDKIEIIKPNGDRYTCDKTIVQSKMIFIYCGKIPLEENDEIIQKIDENRTQEFIVEDRGYHKDKRFGEHFQARVKRKNKTQMPQSIIEENKNESATIKRPSPAYDGPNPYIFISYAHKDSEMIFKEIERFQNEGYNIWYDDGLIPGNNWDEGIVLALSNSSLVVVFITENSVSSENVKKEIALASEENINILPIYLKKTQLPPDLKYHLIRTDAIFKYLLSDEDYLKKCIKAFENIHSPKKEALSPNDNSFDNVILPGCTKKQSLIFKELCDYSLDKGFDAKIDPMAILDMASKYYDEENQADLADRVRPSLKNLEKNNYITSDGSSLGMGVSTSSITFTGFHFYLENIAEDKNIYPNVVRAIFIDKLSEIDEICEKYEIRRSIVEMLVKSFKRDEFIIYNNDLTDITLTPAGEEYFEEILNQ